ncbi:alanine--tRNA ligase [candidate division WOR-3 bacterium RBG_13_43_14]|uniref:Alanine--tRNA ligase n=1 Tax=candidate division WOR-3 bacterium RBG_13_43_14 TaxID=1802590 RepID=A0A1F4UDJ3_UNCW3|nr:MAG: alanine--tRNA ligase [candidate division WOR-3 bacterium RBG_13_43_14]
MTSDQIRQSFLDFFKKKDHIIVSSMSLIPRDDPSLLFTSAGMVQFKPLWTGSIPLPYRRAASTQKCFRTSDLDNVGRTRRHLTFFEMLGNFSFGDYFKEEAIVWAWEYFIDVLNIDKSKLYASVFTDDDEAYGIWNKKIGLNPDRIFRLGADFNFWGPAGNSGPCGPCSEIFYDLGDQFGCGKKDCAPGCDCDRFPEVWNLVFPQFDQAVSGERKPLKYQGIDTGMGMERLTMVLQGKDSNFKTDLFYPIIEEICRVKKTEYGRDANNDLAINVIADHLRALVFAIGDGIIPSNEERGYVLRRILRRAVRLGRNLGQAEASLHKLVPLIVEMYQKAFPGLQERREEITLVIKSEEDRFLDTLEKGLAQFEDISRSKRNISGEDAFKLYDTFGFPVELTREIAEEKGLDVDETGFLEMLDKAREISKTKAKFIPKGEWKIIKEGNGVFVGYDKNEIETEIIRYNEYENIIEVVLAESPFYAEAGGQIGDQGELTGVNYTLKVPDTYWLQGMIVCHCETAKGKFTPGPVIARVDMKIRKESARAHTSTHLLHAALRKTLGEHARQEGSFVEPGRFRFDFTHFKPLSEDEITAIEDLVNEKIMAALPVKKFFTKLDQAKKLGAMAIFGEKYGNEVRVVQIDDFSIELCGGIHIDNTGEIGLFKIISQEAAAAGIRRIEAQVGLKLFHHLHNNDVILKELSRLVGSSDKDLIKWVSETQQQFRHIEKEYEDALNELARTEAMVLLAKLYQEKSNFISQELKNYGPKGMRMVADMIREKAKDSIGFLYENVANRINYLIFVGDNKVKIVPAGKLIKEISKILGGGGGGRPHLAEGGGGDPAKITAAIDRLRKIIS